MSSNPLLRLTGVDSSRGESQILHDVTLSVPRGSIVALVGRNGVGKTTTLETIMGLTDHVGGKIEYAGESILDLPTEAIAGRGISMVPEDRRIFGKLTVAENLEISARNAERSFVSVDEVYDIFPILRERRDVRGTALSGGQQQMLAVARALVRNTELLLLDEPMEGLAPTVVSDIEAALTDIIADVTVLVVAQEKSILDLCDHAYVLENGRIVYDGAPDVDAVWDQLQI